MNLKNAFRAGLRASQPQATTWANISQELTPANALEYSRTTDKLVFCADLTGLSVDSRLLGRFESELLRLAVSLGHIDQPQENQA
jgi:hypothetical protein